MITVKPVLVEDQWLQSNLYWSRTNDYSQTCTGREPIISQTIWYKAGFAVGRINIW